ncbi:MAG: CRISPR-associated endonuclease Cas1 [Candidatus Dojkabacteria bacterium]|nr:CRISPR-associated endonuclease Cas1 [Candidatus Dojkabacteria bacterium]
MSYLSDKTTLYLFSDSYSIELKNKKILVNKHGMKVDEIPFFHLTTIVINHNCGVDPKILRYATRNKISIVFIDGNFNFVASVKHPESKNIFLRKLQYEKFSDPSFAIETAKKIITAKLINCAGTIRQNRSELVPWINSIRKVKSVDDLRGIEGSYANYYFAVFGKQLVSSDFKWFGRFKYPAVGEINALLSWGYTLLGTEIQTFCEIIGLDPYLGFMHTNYYGRPSLVCDLIEEYRPWVVDRFVLNLINRKQIRKEHFKNMDGLERLNASGYKVFQVAWLKRMRGIKKYQIIHKTKLSIRGVIEMQTRLISKSLTDEYSYQPFVP